MTRKPKIKRLTEPAGTQAGAALFVALIMLLLITIIGLAAARTQTLEVRMAANTQNRNIAEEAAEAALRAGENGYASGLYTNFTGTVAGLYTFNPNSTAPPAYMCVASWANYAGSNCPTPATSQTIAYSGPGFPSPQQPTFTIEMLPAVCTVGCSLNLGNSGRQPPPVVLRITANGVGGDGTSTVRLQSIYH